MRSSFDQSSLVSRIAVSHDALLNVVDQTARAQGPLTLSVLADNSLSEVEGARLGCFRFFLVCLGLVDLDQCRLTPCCLVQSLRSGGRLIVLLGVLLVHLRFFFRTL